MGEPQRRPTTTGSPINGSGSAEATSVETIHRLSMLPLPRDENSVEKTYFLENRNA
jgi:hypothetical protein